MNERPRNPSPREQVLLDAAYAYVLEHGLAATSLRPLAAAIGSSTRVLMFLFGNKDGLIRAILARARREELEALRSAAPADADLATTTLALWRWLSAEAHRPVLRLWVESYSRSLVDPDGPWGGFAEQTVNDWLTLLDRGNPGTRAEATLALAVLRGALLDLLATSDQTRTDRAITAFTESMAQP